MVMRVWEGDAEDARMRGGLVGKDDRQRAGLKEERADADWREYRGRRRARWLRPFPESPVSRRERRGPWPVDVDVVNY